MEKALKHTLLFLFLGLLLPSCNLALHQQKKVNRQFEKQGIQEHFYCANGDTLHYYEGGTGKTVLLIHGFGGDAQTTWEETIKDLSKDYHVIAPDLLWFGQSNSTRSPNLAAQVAVISNLLNLKAVQSCSVVGISYGGFVTMGLFYAIPEKVDAMCIVDSPGITYDITLLDTLCKQENVTDVSDIFVVRSPNGVQKLFDLAFYKDRNIPKFILNDIYEAYFNQHHDKLIELLATLPNTQKEYLAQPKITFPKSLVIWGSNDAVFPKSEGKRLAEFMHADYQEIRNAGHGPNIEQHEIFEKVLRDFLN